MKYCANCMQPLGEAPFCPHCGWDSRTQNLPHQLPCGTVLGDRYLVGRVLGQGGFGITYMGYDQLLDIPVAIKEYYPNGFVTRETSHSTMVTDCGMAGSHVVEANRKRFLKEAQSLAKLSNLPEVVHVQNFFPANGTAYIVMEYIQGSTLKSYVNQYGRLDAGWVLGILRPAMQALQKVHEAGIVHRDISPDNIMVLPDGKVKLLDFGAVRDYSLGVTHNTQAVVKPGFAPPEQYQQNGNIGSWTDVYAFCATLYYCMTGQLAPDAPKRMMENVHPDFTQIPGLNPRQIQILERGMALRYSERIQSVEQLAYLLFAPDSQENHAQQEQEENLRRAREEAERMAREQAASKAREVTQKAEQKKNRGNRRKLEHFEKSSLLTIGLTIAVIALVLIFGKQDPPKVTPGVSTSPISDVTEPKYTAEVQNFGDYSYDTKRQGDKTHFQAPGLDAWLGDDGLLEVTVNGLTIRDSYQVNDPEETDMVHQYNWTVAITTPDAGLNLSTHWAVELGEPVKTVTLDQMDNGLWLRKEEEFAEGRLVHTLVDTPVQMHWDDDSITWTVQLSETMMEKFDSEKINGFQLTVYETEEGETVKRKYGQIQDPWDTERVDTVLEEAKNIEVHSATDARFEESYDATATYTDDGMVIVGPGLQIVVENGRDMIVDLFGLNIHDDYTINYAGSKQYYVEAGWVMQLLSNEELVELSTRITHDEPGKERTITPQDMKHYISAQYNDMGHPESVDYIDTMTWEKNHIHWEASVPSESQFSYNEGLQIPFDFREFDNIVFTITDVSRNVRIERTYHINK